MCAAVVLTAVDASDVLHGVRRGECEMGEWREPSSGVAEARRRVEVGKLRTQRVAQLTQIAQHLRKMTRHLRCRHVQAQAGREEEERSHA